MSETTNETTQETAAQQDADAQDVNEQRAESEDSPPTSEASGSYMFPHESPSDHWDVDFGDGKQVYEGAALPVWILAGWAAFILWAMVYLIFGLPTAF